MVTRTHDPTGAQLAIPEIYLIGGRKKTGRYADISGEIWKFCPQSARETGNPAPTVNTACEGPVEDAFSGRWSMKSANTTTLSTSEKRSFSALQLMIPHVMRSWCLGAAPRRPIPL